MLFAFKLLLPFALIASCQAEPESLTPPAVETPEGISPAISDSVSDETLWLRAVVLAEANSAFLPGKIIDTDVYYDDGGDLEEQWELHTGLRQQADGTVDWYLIKALENAKDVTNAYQTEFDKLSTSIEDTPTSDLYAGAVGEEDMMLLYPFLAQEQPAIVRQDGSDEETLNGQTYRRIAYKHTVRGITWSGKAWLHTETAMPLKLVLTRPVPFEDEEDEITIETLEMRVVYQSHPKAWYPTDIVIETTFSTKGFLYTYKGRSTSTTELLDYWQWSM